MGEMIHIPVLPDEVLFYLNPKEGDYIIDATLGGGGHAEKILERVGESGKLLGIDRDAESLERAKRRLVPYQNRIILAHGNFRFLKDIIQNAGLDRKEFDGILFDLGMSSFQIEDKSRGFSFISDTLDMRFDPQNQKLTASDIVNKWSEAELRRIFREYGEVRFAGRIARCIANFREKHRIVSGEELAGIIAGCAPFKKKIHPATQVFQALRIAVNDELTNIREGVRQAIDLLAVGGRLTVISFHSLEDRLIKTLFRDYAKSCVCPPDLPICACSQKAAIKILTRKPIVPKQEEIHNNPRSRSAKLRAVEKL